MNKHKDKRSYFFVRTYDEKWCVDGAGTSSALVVVDDKEAAERIRDLMHFAYWEGRDDGREAKAREVLGALGVVVVGECAHGYRRVEATDERP